MDFIPKFSRSVFPALMLLGIPCILPACSPGPQVVAAESLYVRDVSAGLYDIEPIRGEVRPLAFYMDGDVFPCSMCHEGFAGDLTQAALEGQHANITFDHGRNLRCLNCHNPANSDTYVDHDGSEIAGDAPNLLCAKCHGPHYREWETGVHGRSNGTWNSALGERKTLACVQCHNPHHPIFPSMAPLPPHNLTRFGTPHESQPGEASHDE